MRSYFADGVEFFLCQSVQLVFADLIPAKQDGEDVWENRVAIVVFLVDLLAAFDQPVCQVPNLVDVADAGGALFGLPDYLVLFAAERQFESLPSNVLLFWRPMPIAHRVVPGRGARRPSCGHVIRLQAL
ncbi:MAG TPA: hypothetical protein VGJ21_23805 [Terracidiphilus sp.]|jgi:hypothetical protein